MADPDPVLPIVPPVPNADDEAYGQAFAMGVALGRTLPPGNGPIRAVIEVVRVRPR